MTVFPGHGTNPQNGKTSKKNPGRWEGPWLLCGVGTRVSGRQLKRRRWGRICSPETSLGLQSYFPGAQGVGRHPLSSPSLNASPCIFCGVWCCREGGKAATGTHPGLLCSLKTATRVTPPCAFDGLKSPSRRPVPLCLSLSMSLFNMTSVSPGSSHPASPKTSEWEWKGLFVCDHIRCVHLNPVTVCSSKTLEECMSLFSEDPGCVCGMRYPWRSHPRVSAWNCPHMKGFFN